MAAALFHIGGGFGSTSRFTAGLKLGLPACALLAIWSGKMLNHATGYRDAIEYRASVETGCIRKALSSGSRHMHCFAHNELDLMPAYLYAREIGASFTRTFPLRFSRDDPNELLFRFSTASSRQWHANGPVQATQTGLEIEPIRDPQIEFTTGKTKQLASCTDLEVIARVETAGNDLSQLFYLRPGESKFSEARSVKAKLAPREDGGLVQIVLHAWSENGFLDRFRFDPGRGDYRVTVNDIELRCR
jgi:hypothetical protein